MENKAYNEYIAQLDKISDLIKKTTIKIETERKVTDIDTNNTIKEKTNNVKTTKISDLVTSPNKLPNIGSFISGKWEGGAFNEIVEFLGDIDTTSYSAICVKMGNNNSSNKFQLEQKLIKIIEFVDNSTLKGQILVPMTSGTQEWYDFKGKIENNSLNVTIGPGNWKWSYRRVSN